MNKFQINGENNQYLLLQLDKIHGYPDVTCYSGGYDVEGTIRIKSGNYYASGSLWISTGVIYLFKKQLQVIYDNCYGEAKLSNSENDFEMKIIIVNRGRVIIEGRYKELPSIDNELVFSFESDQSYLTETLDELNEISLKYGGMKGINDY